MHTWEIVADANLFRVLHILDLSPGEIEDAIQSLRFGSKVGMAWKPLRVELFTNADDDGEDRKRVGDFPSLGGTTPLAISVHALEVLFPLVRENVEMLDLMGTDTGPLQALNVLMCDCLDHSRCVYTYFTDGSIMDVEIFAFKPGVLEGKHIFRIPEVWTRTFVDDVFKRAVEQNELEGLLFYKLPEVGETAG